MSLKQRRIRAIKVSKHVLNHDHSLNFVREIDHIPAFSGYLMFFCVIALLVYVTQMVKCKHCVKAVWIEKLNQNGVSSTKYWWSKCMAFCLS